MLEFCDRKVHLDKGFLCRRKLYRKTISPGFTASLPERMFWLYLRPVECFSCICNRQNGVIFITNSIFLRTASSPVYKYEGIILRSYLFYSYFTFISTVLIWSRYDNENSYASVYDSIYKRNFEKIYS